MRKKITLIFLFLFFTLSYSNASFLLLKDEGIEKYRQKYYIDSHKIFLNYTINNPSDPDGFYWLALAYKALKNDKKAQTYFECAYKMMFEQGNIEQITLKKTLRGDLSDYFDMAALYFEQKNYQKASQYADIMLSISDECADAYFLKARIAYEKGNKKEALENLNKAIIFDNSLLDTTLAQQLEVSSIPSSSAQIYSKSAVKHYFTGDIDNAIEYLKKYIDLDDKNIDTYNFLISCYIKKNMLDEAQKTADKAFLISENNVSLILNQAEIYRLKKNALYEKTLLKGYTFLKKITKKRFSTLKHWQTLIILIMKGILAIFILF